jgi:MscS family membrane protein
MDPSTARRERRPPLAAAPPWRALLILAALLAAALPGLRGLAQEAPTAARDTAAEAPAEAPAEASPTEAPPPEPYDYRDELQRDTPRGAVVGYLRAGRDNDWERAARYLDLSRLSPGERVSEGPRLARQLKRVLDRELWVEPESLSDEPSGDTGDGLPPGRDRLGTVRLGDEDVPIRVERVPEDGETVWKLSAATVARIEGLYAEYGYGVLDEWLPPLFFAVSFMELQLWQWIGLALLLILVWLVSSLAARAAVAAVRPLVRRSETTLDDRLIADGAPPLGFLIGLALFALGLPLLRLAAPAEAFLYDLLQALAVLAVVWLTFRLVDIGSGWARKELEEGGQHGAVALLPLGRRTVKVFLGALGVLAVLQNLGVNVTALLTGLGVGGLAVALAAQKTLENLFGGISLAVDQPVRVGDFCRFGDQVGTVEDVGLRSTRIRTLDRTVVSIPNADFSTMPLENFAKRDRIRLILTLGLRYETTAEQLRHVLVGLRKLLLAHPRVSPEPARVRFVGFGAYSLDLEVFAYVETADINEFLAIREDLLLRFIDVVEASGSDFAFPSQTTYIERGSGLDAERVAAAEAEVRAWREANDLPLPDFRPEALAEIDDTLDWPPRGSAARAAQEAAAGAGETSV